MGAMQRRKGADGEREVVHLLRDLLGVEMTRNLVQSRDGGCDLLGLDGWAIEVKRAKKPLLNAWWEQACEQADYALRRPVLFYRLDRQSWRVVLALRHVAAGFEASPLSLRIETDAEVFAAIAREYVAAKAISARERLWLSPHCVKPADALPLFVAENRAAYRQRKES